MKKEQRKQLELELLKQIEQTLHKHNAVAVKKIIKTVQEACKKISKKFHKAIPASIEKKQTKKSVVKKHIATKKPSTKSTVKKRPTKKRK